MSAVVEFPVLAAPPNFPEIKIILIKAKVRFTEP